MYNIKKKEYCDKDSSGKNIGAGFYVNITGWHEHGDNRIRCVEIKS